MCTVLSWGAASYLPSLGSSRQGTGGGQGVRGHLGGHLLPDQLGRTVLRPECHPKKGGTKPERAGGLLIPIKTGVDSVSNVQRWGFTYNSDFENLRFFKPSQSWGRSLGPQLPNTCPPTPALCSLVPSWRLSGIQCTTWARSEVHHGPGQPLRAAPILGRQDLGSCGTYVGNIRKPHA